jgi:hypothetical protein
VADTYPSLGIVGVHLQPQERLAAAIERREGPAGGVIVVACSDDAPTIRATAGALGLAESVWDNGTVTDTGTATGTATGAGTVIGTATDTGTVTREAQ